MKSAYKLLEEILIVDGPLCDSKEAVFRTIRKSSISSKVVVFFFGSYSTNLFQRQLILQGGIASLWRTISIVFFVVVVQTSTRLFFALSSFYVVVQGVGLACTEYH